MSGEWPGFVPAPCADCGCPGGHHQPRCINVVVRAARREYCGCLAYRCDEPQQAGLFATPGRAP